MKVYLASVTHKHGLNLYAGGSKEELLEKLANYVRAQGGPDEWAGSYKPVSAAEIAAMSDQEVVENYFLDHPSEFVDEESDFIRHPVSNANPRIDMSEPRISKPDKQIRPSTLMRVIDEIALSWKGFTRGF